MKRILLFSLSAAMIALTFSSYTTGPFKGGAGNHTGSAGSTANCSTGSGCHATNTTNTNGVLGITTLTNGPVLTYTPGVSYFVTITAGNTASLPKFGFQASCVKASATSTQAGTFTATTTNVQVSNPSGVQLVEHKSLLPGIAPGTYQVSFKWTAPPAGTGTVRFYSIINAVDGTGTSSGDQPNPLAVYNLDEGTTGVSAVKPVAVAVYPNPAADELHIKLSKAGDCLVNVFDVSGKVIARQSVVAANGSASINTANLRPGNYFILAQQGDRQYSAAFQKQ